MTHDLWGVWTRGKDTHVMPCDADGNTDHVDKPTCWCRPTVIKKDLATGCRVYNHKKPN